MSVTDHGIREIMQHTGLSEEDARLIANLKDVPECDDVDIRNERGELIPDPDPGRPTEPLREPAVAVLGKRHRANPD